MTDEQRVSRAYYKNKCILHDLCKYISPLRIYRLNHHNYLCFFTFFCSFYFYFVYFNIPLQKTERYCKIMIALIDLYFDSLVVFNLIYAYSSLFLSYTQFHFCTKIIKHHMQKEFHFAVFFFFLVA